MSLMPKRRFFVKNLAVIIMLFFSSRSHLHGQSRPFPQNVDYPYGYKTSVISAADLQVVYERWKKI